MPDLTQIVQLLTFTVECRVAAQTSDLALLVNDACDPRASITNADPAASDASVLLQDFEGQMMDLTTHSLSN